jgi:UDP-2-acetamido-3-amino-2,3-dideoxy-glucuronate N-acetyltransferase
MRNKARFIGLVGLGRWGQNLLRNLAGLGVLHSACDVRGEILTALAHHHGDVLFTDSFDDLIGNDELQAIAIATPSPTHYPLVRAALAAGKDVFVEKPLALAVDEAQEVADIAGRDGRILMVGHLLQYHPAIIKLKELIDSGALGAIRYISSNRLNTGQLRREENILWSFAPHDISVIIMLLGTIPQANDAYGSDLHDNGIYDTTLTTMTFPGGVKSHIYVSWLHPFKEHKLVVVGTKAMAVFDEIAAEKLRLFHYTVDWENHNEPVATRDTGLVIPFPTAEPLAEEMKHFVECIIQRKRPRTDGQEGLQVLKIIDEADRALRKSRRRGDSCPGEAKGAYFLHESSYKDDGAVIGAGTRIWHFSHILKNVVVGTNCTIGQNVVIGPDVEVGDRCKIQNNVFLCKGVTLEPEVFCGPSCVFTNVYNPRAFIERKHEFLPTVVRRGATIGANATILCGVTIGKYSMVGAGAVVRADVPDHAIAAGVPARLVGWACFCGRTLDFRDNLWNCPSCGRNYHFEGPQAPDSFPLSQ